MRIGVLGTGARVPGEHDVFVAGNDAAAKAETVALLQSFGWPAERIVDLGDIAAARGTEMYLPLWLRLLGTLGTADFNIRVVR
jgi:predicted dinucleotide-binding enzyme